jgi:hypothetical protein
VNFFRSVVLMTGHANHKRPQLSTAQRFFQTCLLLGKKKLCLHGMTIWSIALRCFKRIMDPSPSETITQHII